MSNRIVICGTQHLSQYVVTELILQGYTDIVFCENGRISSREIQGFPVYKGEELKSISQIESSTALITARNAKSIYEIIDILDAVGINSIGIVKYRTVKWNIPVAFGTENEEIIWYKKEGVKKRILPRLEFNVIDGCNLTCKGCTHFSSLYPKESVADFEQYKRDLLRLKEIGEVVRLRFVGGEPLLVEDLDEYFDVARHIFPDADLEIATNGLLIPKVNQKIWDSVKKNQIRITVSPYKPTLAMKEEISSALMKQGIIWEFVYDKIDYFVETLTLCGDKDGNVSSQNCLNAGFPFLRNGHIYKCSIEGLFDDFQKYYNLNVKEKSEGIDIYHGNVEEIFESIKRCSLQSSEMCNYCSPKEKLIPWECKSKPKLEDWLFS